MATEEMKPETKKSEQKQSTEVKDLPPPPVPLAYKTCNLKVSTHCDGCKRKFTSVTLAVGVYRVDINVKQNKVTVMGIASPEILLKKLHKAGKTAYLLPEIPEPVDPKENKPEDPKENKPVVPKQKNKKKKKEEPEITNVSTSSGTDKPESGKPDGAGECSPGNEKKVVLKENDSVPVDSPSPPPVDSPAPTEEKKAEESGGNVGKKKKTMGKRINNSTGGPVRTQSLPPPATTPEAGQDRPFNQNDGHQILTNNNPPHDDMYPYPPHYYAPQIMYGVSYNVAQSPPSLNGGSYYSPAPPHSHAYMHPGYLPSDQNLYHPRPSDSFELFSDENPNGCSVM
ncbi:unnamed protein product, partial [Thlaspi arvense]